MFVKQTLKNIILNFLVIQNIYVLGGERVVGG